MPTPDGYKIYWGTSPTSLTGVHPNPAKSQYNSPIAVSGGTTSQYTFPSDFWDASFTELYFSVVAVSGSEEGVPSKPVELVTAQKSLVGGVNMFSIPLDDGNTYTAKQLATVLQAAVLVWQGSGISSYTPGSPTSGPTLRAQDGVIVNSAGGKTITWRGRAWKDVA